MPEKKVELLPPLSMWCIANVARRLPFLVPSTLRRTRREAWQALEEAWGPFEPRPDPKVFRPVRVTVGVDRSAS